MKKLKRWRYYCDFCKKAGGSAPAMERHEKSCTMNPNRNCRMCDHWAGGCDFERVKEVAKLIIGKTSWLVYREGDEAIEVDILNTLRDEAGGCPACMLAAMRQTDTVALFTQFSYEKEKAEFWKVVNNKRASHGWY